MEFHFNLHYVKSAAFSDESVINFLLENDGKTLWW